ncbi:52 kDa repressor of the inhibitor of the protein kinase-like [Acyrthosiphon pisum]|uniref:HAT C-terminal dimerisation domain-containing protein n=1 Tax=Acyrthosiphon pisum TaxID=7029 RepID=A0A8R2BAM0_ACYPI|nr:52 kDa repressor of the inhibitor of the protein kinase-like [Acyrthosiphon pisum]|eukprot:XP_008189667.1 PREDICTED: 52 kDa repressor of the inhibitor of the protein kinase-like [Acyrthosiphon pisum]
MDDLPGFKDTVDAEYDLWISKWTSLEPSSRPSTFTDALISCDKTLYPNLYQLLKILAILPVSTASAERSFLTRLKTYLRNSTSENRLVSLALLNIHRNICTMDDMVLDKFANSGRARQLKLVI